MTSTSKKMLVLDCSAGLSGDMAAGAVADLLNDDDAVLEALSFLKTHGYQAGFETVRKQDRTCRHFYVRPIDPDMKKPSHVHRTLQDVTAIIAEASLTTSARALAYHVYDIIAQAEAIAHDMPAEEVHFHEVASLPSIADVIAFSVCYDRLGIGGAVIDSLYEGRGTVQCDHGELEVPVPAVRNILSANQLPLNRADASGEILTPTGAAIAAAVRTAESLPDDYRVLAEGYGAGMRDTGLRGYASAQLIELAERNQRMNNDTVPVQEYAYMETLKAHLMHLLETTPKRLIIAAIDGRCASGKTTAAILLQKQYGWTVVHADDFFLRPEQRTPERYAEPGGNLDRERLKEEVLIPLREGKAVNYRRFDCSKMELGETVAVPMTDLVIVEGSYSLHPELRELYDLKIFFDVSADEQLRRIAARSGREKLEAFIDRWIPLEEKYFSGCSVSETADLHINTSMQE